MLVFSLVKQQLNVKIIRMKCVDDGRPSAHFNILTGNSKSEHVVEMQPNVEWHSVYRPRRIQQTFIRVWYDRMMTTIKQLYPKRQVISVFKVASSFACTPRWADDQRERTCLQLCTCAWRLALILTLVISRTVAVKIRKLASFSLFYLIFRIKLLSDPLISIKELIIFNIIYIY